MNSFVKRFSRSYIFIAMLAILLVGAYLRLYKISEYMTFLGDEGRDVLVVKRMIVDHRFTLLGPTASVGGFFLGPIYYYFMLPFLWAWKLDPTGPAVMVALFGVATIYLVYRLGRELIGPESGLVAASLYALSPLAIAYSRSSWNPNLVPFFSILLVYLLWWTVAKKRWIGLLWSGTVLGIGLQLHYLFLFLFVVCGVWFFVYGRTWRLKYYFTGLVGFFIGYAPFLAFELRHGFPNTQTIIRFVLEGKDTGFSWQYFLGNMSDVLFRLFGRLVYRLPQPELWNNYATWQQWLWAVVILTSVFVSLAILVANVTRRVEVGNGLVGKHLLTKTRSYFGQPVVDQPGSLLLLMWLLVVVVLFGFYKRAIYDYYFGIVFPLPFILVSLVFVWVRRFRLGKVVALVVFGGVLVFNWQGRPFLYPPNNQLAQAKRIAREALDKTGGKPFNFALITLFNSDHAYRYFFEIWGNKPVTIENEINDPQRQTVTDQLIVICELTECAPLGHPLWEIAGFGRAQILGEWDVPFVKIFKLIHYKGEMP